MGYTTHRVPWDEGSGTAVRLDHQPADGAFRLGERLERLDAPKLKNWPWSTGKIIVETVFFRGGWTGFYPRCSMVLEYAHLHLPLKNDPNVGKYSIHGAFGYVNLKDVSSKLRMQGGTGCWIYGRVDQLLWNLFHGERWRSSIPIVKWPIRTLWMIQDMQRPLKLLYRSSIDCQNHNLDPKSLKNHLKYQYVGCWFGVESLQEIEGFKFRLLCGRFTCLRGPYLFDHVWSSHIL